ncbi:MAG: hypothetical protein HZC55_10015 [Verrucomicrobia bacterium]|jgi:hypothetical protein|nr:hypothetical protein [Verrucomicrobiota bacterium]
MPCIHYAHFQLSLAGKGTPASTPLIPAMGMMQAAEEPAHDLAAWLRREQELLAVGWGENGRPPTCPSAMPRDVIDSLTTVVES